MVLGLCLSAFNIYLWVMIAIAMAVFVSLYFVDAGYGMLRSAKWGKSINNKVAWFYQRSRIIRIVDVQ